MDSNSGSVFNVVLFRWPRSKYFLRIWRLQLRGRCLPLGCLQRLLRHLERFLYLDGVASWGVVKEVLRSRCTGGGGAPPGLMEARGYPG